MTSAIGTLLIMFILPLFLVWRVSCKQGRHARLVSSITAATAPPTTGEDMPTFVMLTTLTSEGVQTVKNNPNRIKEVNKELEQIGARVVAQWATLGRFDFVNIVEAPDEKTMAKVSLELGSRGTAHYESLPAIPIDEFIDFV